jgi:hypothetical protein
MVAEMPIPENQGQLKQFVGLGNYFRTLIADYANLTHDLNSMLENYEKRNSKKKLGWTDHLKQQFIECQKAIVESCFT